MDKTNPDYYKLKKIEVIDCIESMIAGLPSDEAFNAGQVLKYLSRYNEKNGMEDLKKATWYLERLKKCAGERYDSNKCTNIEPEWATTTGVQD